MRIAYYNLVLMDEDTDDWDLSEYLNNRDNRIQLYGIYWTNTEDYLTYISDYDDPSNYLTGSSLPNNMSEEADYYFTHDENHTLLGYKNKDDVGDRFKAYKILSIDEEQIRVHCYADKETYTLDAQ